MECANLVTFIRGVSLWESRCIQMARVQLVSLNFNEIKAELVQTVRCISNSKLFSILQSFQS